MRNTLSTRLATLLLVCAMVAVVAVPMLGTAQDATPEVSEEDVILQGAGIYYNVCVACHQVDGNGVPGIFLPLNRGGLVMLEDPDLLIYTVLYGRGGMPRFNDTYSDAEIAAVLTFIRQEWDNDMPPVSEEDVARVRGDYSATPIVSPTPEGQIPEGVTHPEERSDPSDATPESTPLSTPAG